MKQNRILGLWRIRFAITFAAHLVAGMVEGAPVVSNIHASPQTGTSTVDVFYDLASSNNTLTVSLAISTNGGSSFSAVEANLTGAIGAGVTPGKNKKIACAVENEWTAHFLANAQFRVLANDSPVPAGMALIPDGNFMMGNGMNPSEGDTDELPLHTVYVSAFYMDKNDVTKALWDKVCRWATNHGYGFEYGIQEKAPNHPAMAVTWYDAVKWCNARSEMEGQPPSYYADTNLSVPFRNGQIAPSVDWSRGYRLPTEAEWEKAARGGVAKQRFPHGNTISWNQANYYAFPAGYAYDVNLKSGNHPGFNDGVYPFTSPVDYFPPNAFGLYDMAGNVWQWCWDWYGPYSGTSQSDPHGPVSGSGRVFRGGGWSGNAFRCRVAARFYYYATYKSVYLGFRSVLPAARQE